MNALELRLEAARLIRRFGWARTALCNYEGSYCMLGALIRAAGRDIPVEKSLWQGEYDFAESSPLLISAIRSMGFERVRDVWMFNDDLSRREEDVLQLLEQS